MKMRGLLTYKGYNGTVEYSKADCCLFGKVIGGIRSLLSYEGGSVAELEREFRNTIDDCLADCEVRGAAPELPYKGVLTSASVRNCTGQ